MMAQICNDLVEAYKGKYEDDWYIKSLYEEFVKKEGQDGQLAVIDYESWLGDWIRNKIEKDDPKTRLSIYLEWNGILGWTNRIWEITQGGIFV